MEENDRITDIKPIKEKKNNKFIIVIMVVALLICSLVFLYVLREYHFRTCIKWIEKGSNMTYSGQEWKYDSFWLKDIKWALIKSDGYDLKKIAKCVE